MNTCTFLPRGGGNHETDNHRDEQRDTQTLPVPPHLHRRPPLRQRLPPQRGTLLLPPHHPEASRQPASTPRPSLHLRPLHARGPLRHPDLHRRGTAAHRLQRHRPPSRRAAPLRSTDRQPQPAPTTARGRPCNRDQRNRGRDRKRPRARHSRSPRGGRQTRTTHQRYRSALRKVCKRGEVRKPGKVRKRDPTQAR
ncbi:MAG: hypothetical protein JWQ42_2100 [Edaphobacter sp.]|nr:hypothetical protein [Edaphobacter sp.]